MAVRAAGGALAPPPQVREDRGLARDAPVLLVLAFDEYNLFDRPRAKPKSIRSKPRRPCADMCLSFTDLRAALAALRAGFYENVAPLSAPNAVVIPVLAGTHVDAGPTGLSLLGTNFLPLPLMGVAAGTRRVLEGAALQGAPPALKMAVEFCVQVGACDVQMLRFGMVLFRGVLEPIEAALTTAKQRNASTPQWLCWRRSIARRAGSLC